MPGTNGASGVREVGNRTKRPVRKGLVLPVALIVAMVPIRTVVLSAAAFALGFFVVAGALPALAANYTIAVLAGVSGPVTTLQCYDPNPQASHPYVSNKPNPFAPCRTGVDDNGDGIYGGTHPGTAPVDIGAGSGTVWAQLDYLPAADKGGYAWVSDTSGACSSWSGSEATIYVYHYGPSGTYYQHSISYQHINITSGLTNRWIAWNNSGATYPYWPQWAAEFKFGNQTAGGEAIGSIFNVVGGNPNCATANHLHQDGSNLTWNYWRWAEGCFQDSGYWGGSRCHSNPSIWAWVTGESVSQRYSDAQYTTIQVN